MKLLLLIVLLITNSICADDCTSLAENTCKETSGCKWKAATCSGHNSCTSKTTSQSECTGTSYTEKIKCTYTAASTTAATCTGDDVCERVNELDDNSACTAKKYGGTACTFTPAVTDGASASCSGDGGSVCSSVTPLNEENCQNTFYNQDSCSYTAAVTNSPTCTGDDGTLCSNATPLTSPTACESIEYDGNPKNCVYSAGSCTTDTPQETEESEETEETEDTEKPGKTDTSSTTNNGGDSSNTEKDNSGYIKISLLFSLLYLLF